MKMPFSIPGRGVRAEYLSGSESSSPAAIVPNGSAAAVYSGADVAGYSATESLFSRVKQAAGFAKKGLSDAARNKLVLIGERAANARGAAEKARNDIDQLREDLAKAELDISIQEEQRANRRDTDPEPVILRKAREDAALIKTEISRLQSRASEYTAISSETAALSSALSKYVARIKDTASSHTIEVEPRVLGGEGPGDSVERLRRRIRELKSDLDQVRCAPYPASEAKQLVRAQIDQLAMRGAPTLFDVIDRRGDIKWPELTTRSMSISVGTEPAQMVITTTPDTLAILAWLHLDALIAGLDREIEASSQDDQALTDEQRTKKSAQILSDILATEREEEALIEQMETSGAVFLRRVDADPRAVLGLSSDMPVPDVAHR
jgi:hypothetical protein